MAGKLFSKAIDLYANRPGVVETSAFAASALAAGIVYAATDGTGYKKGVDSLFAFSTVSAVAQGISGTILSTRAGHSALAKRIGSKEASRFAYTYLASGYTSAALGAGSYFTMEDNIGLSTILGAASSGTALLGTAMAFSTGYTNIPIKTFNSAIGSIYNRKK